MFLSLAGEGGHIRTLGVSGRALLMGRLEQRGWGKGSFLFNLLLLSLCSTLREKAVNVKLMYISANLVFISYSFCVLNLRICFERMYLCYFEHDFNVFCWRSSDQ